MLGVGGRLTCCLALSSLLVGCVGPFAQPTSGPTPPAAVPTSAPAAATTAPAPAQATPAAAAPTPAAATPTAAAPKPAAASKPGADLPRGTVQLGNLTFNNHGLEDARGKDDLDIEAKDFYFEPTFLRGNPGQKLRLEIENDGRTEHNFSIAAQQLDSMIPRDGEIVVEITFPASGALRFFCKIHAGQGMNGQLLAGDAQPQPVSAIPGPDLGTAALPVSGNNVAIALVPQPLGKVGR